MIRSTLCALIIAAIVCGDFSMRADAAIATRSTTDIHTISASNSVSHFATLDERSIPRADHAPVGSVQALLVTPKDDGGLDGANMRPVRVLSELRTRREIFRPAPRVDLTFMLQPGERKIIRNGTLGVRVVIEHVTTWDSVVVGRQIQSRTLLRKAQPDYVVEGAPRTLAQLSTAEKIGRLVSAMTMVATAYTASSASPWSSGYTANGMLARYGVAAVDPRVIPLGSRLFIPGYGIAVAADTGGAIIGSRVDLCFNSIWEALQFGRRVVKVYLLKR